jgi:hydantoinase/carbamoylase family amidase
MLSSGVWAEQFTLEYGHGRSDANGVTLKSELERIEFLGPEPCSYKDIPLLAHFELHIEQGPSLDAAEEPVAVVKGVQSMRWYNIHVTGAEAHTGTTPMNRRRDALLGAAQMIVECNRLSTTAESMEKENRMTIAVINSMPQSINTISGHVQLNLDIRSPADSDVEAMETACRENFAKIAKDSGLEVTFECIWISPAVVFDEVMVGCVRESAKEVQCAMELTSGAGHDSVYTSKRCPTAMIFVRCKDGISHNPAEYTRPEE